MTQSHFGFTSVDASQRQGLVNDVFRRVASRYDRMNDAMSLGLHRLWKRELAGQVGLRPHEKLLDLAGGTGDIALRVAATLPAPLAERQITLCDINPAMLAEAQRRLYDAGYAAGIDVVTGNAESLPFAPCSFHAVTMAFGLRNVTGIENALSSVHRVLKPGGRFFCLEFSQPSLPWLASLYERWSFDVIPALGERIAADRASYQYLVESIRRFPSADHLAGLMETAGFWRPQYRLFHNGIVALHWGYRV